MRTRLKNRRERERERGGGGERESREFWRGLVMWISDYFRELLLTEASLNSLFCYVSLLSSKKCNILFSVCKVE